MSIDRRRLPLVAVVAVVALAVQVWLLSGCSVMVGSSVWQVALTLLLCTVWVMVCFGFYSGFVWSLKRLLIAALVFVVLASMVLAAAALAEVPVAVVCV